MSNVWSRITQAFRLVSGKLPALNQCTNKAVALLDHDHRVQRFCDDLGSQNISDVIRKHITTGEPVGIEPDKYFELRRQVSKNFNLHPSAVVLVGSCRLGFSLKRKKHGRYEAISHASDVDVAVISSVLFDSYWDRIFDVVQNDRDWAINKGKKFSRDLFCGWLTPEELPNLPRFADSREWAEFFAKLTRERLCGRRTISARLYRSWSRLEAYQEIMVRECQSELRRAL
jgi:hypothetical protein